MISDHISITEYNPYYTQYINNACDIDIVKGLKENLERNLSFYSNIPEEKHNYAYAEGKWTVKQVLLHIIDTERIFAYRALRIARNDKTPLAGFEQDDYVDSANTSNRSMDSLLDEYESVRNASISLFESLNTEELKRVGVASNSPISVRAIGYILTGHENHHNRVIRQKYL